MKKIFSLIILSTACWCSMSATSKAALADTAYNREEYSTAISLYGELLDSLGRSADLYYNIGNAYYRSGDVAHAVLSYERALRADPTHKDARANLEFVNSRLEDKPEENNSFLSRVHGDIVTAMTSNTWAMVAVVAFLILLGAIAAYIFVGNVNMRKVGFFTALVFVPLTIYLLVVAHDAASRINDHSEAIVIVPNTLLNSVPRQPKQTETVVPLHEGTKVKILDSIATPDDPVSPRWYNVTINGSRGAWLRATDVERI